MTEIIWRLIRNLVSESLIKDHWLQMIDFLFAYNHKPEMILYVASSFILSLKNEILTSNDASELKSQIFDTSNYTKLTNIFKKSKELYKKYNKYQIYKYYPYYPIYEENADNIKNEMMRINKEFDEKDMHLERTEKYFKDLLRKEKAAQRKFLSELNKETMKEYITKHELSWTRFLGIDVMLRNSKFIDNEFEWYCKEGIPNNCQKLLKESWPDPRHGRQKFPGRRAPRGREFPRGRRGWGPLRFLPKEVSPLLLLLPHLP